MKFHVEQWSPDYGSPMEEFDPHGEVTAKIDTSVEVPTDRWAPIASMSRNEVGEILFVDGVRRIDAMVWIVDGDTSAMAICASCAAGVARCDGAAKVVEVGVQRILVGAGLVGGIVTKHGVFEPRVAAGSDQPSLMNRLAESLSELEVEVAHRAGIAPLVVIDGPLRGRENIPGAVGYIKTHRAIYLNQDLNKVVASLKPGERTPLFAFETSWTRYSWYLRLPFGKGHPWAGIVRCEAPTDMGIPAAMECANAVAATLPKYASQPHKDSRAPQNLYPIAGLENHLKHRLGATEVLYRAIAVAAAQG